MQSDPDHCARHFPRQRDCRPSRHNKRRSEDPGAHARGTRARGFAGALSRLYGQHLQNREMTAMDTRTQVIPGRGIETNRIANGISFSSHRRWSAQSIPTREVPPSTTLFLQGSSSREVFYVERGLVKLTHISENGQEFAVDLPSQGSLLGAA